VIDVERRQLQSVVGRQSFQEREERGGIGAAGERDQDVLTTREHCMAAKRGANGIERDGHRQGASLPAVPPRPRRPPSAPSSRRGPSDSTCRSRSYKPRNPPLSGQPNQLTQPPTSPSPAYPP